MDQSGKKDRVLISCVTFEVAKVIEPAIYYEATRIHLIHYDAQKVYEDFYNEVCRRIAEELPKAEVIEHKIEVYDFTKLMSTILSIIREEQNSPSDIYVNVSAGSSEYSAASLIASMMAKNVLPFNVTTDEFQVSPEKIREVYYENDRPVGLSKKCKEPKMLATYVIQKPDEKLVLALGVLKEHIDNGKPTSAPVMIRELGDMGILKYTTAGTGKSTRPDQKSTMSYQRNFIDNWIGNGWVVKVSKREMAITPDGEMVLNTFLDSYRINLRS